jgi:nucleotide-binding universal stress UspA family protein
VIKHLLVPLDGSHLAESVLPTAAFLADKIGASVTLIHIIEKNAPEEVHGEQHLTNVEQANFYLQKTAEQYFPKSTKVNLHVHTEEITDIPGSLVSHSGEFVPDLIVMCSHGHSGMRDWMVGSIAQQVIGRGTTPILLLKPAPSQSPVELPLQKLMVTLDGDPEHEQGLTFAAALAAPLAASLHLMSVVETYNSLKGERAAAGRLLPGAARAMLDIGEECTAEYLEGLAAPLRQQGLSVSTEVCRGDPVQTILQVGRDGGMDLIILGTHGKAGWQAFWAGSVAARVITQIQLPVLLVPAHKAGASNE